jgi:FMN phosphatase YigB (HAD superfamily)
MSAPAEVAFLVDVDNTLLDNDRVLDDLRQHMVATFGAPCWERYWTILMGLVDELGYRDYLGALQRYRIEHPHDPHVVATSFFLLDYPFAERVLPGAFDVLARLRRWGPTVLVTDGDAVFQPRKVLRAGLWDAVDGHVLIYVDKVREIADVERRYPARHYVLVDDKLRILTPVKAAWGGRVTTVFPRQGQYARDPQVLASHPRADLSVERIADLLGFEAAGLIEAARGEKNHGEGDATASRGRAEPVAGQHHAGPAD